MDDCLFISTSFVDFEDAEVDDWDTLDEWAVLRGLRKTLEFDGGGFRFKFPGFI